MARFRARARAVDMLGRQQIAGIPTAISELFKNAHDAYADEAIVDWFRSDGLFVLRDDGIGMTLEDFEQRWLTLGTESKVKGGGMPELRPPGVPMRAVLGEKGIGRLAIAAIGPQVLVLSRAEREGDLSDLLVCLLHWGLFELPGVDLDEIVLPLHMMPGGELPDSAFVAQLADEIRANLGSLDHHADKTFVADIEQELIGLKDLDPSELDRQITGPSLRDGHGTQFFIRPSSPLLARDLDQLDAKEAPDLLRTLVGFANTMTSAAPPVLQTSFRHHYSDDASEELIGLAEFFTPAEVRIADHHITGEFDAFGQFVGTVAVYRGEPAPYLVSWPARGGETRCGPFRLDLSYVQGQANQTALDPDAWTSISAKLDRFGGLYVYRDGIRVLPYGNSDFDWLDVERRRTLSASDAFFSYRRMFGAVEITREYNHELREKAGREGFAANLAYREFREILMNFLYRVAFDFYREAGARSEQFLTKRAEIQRLDKARARRAKQVGTRRKTLAAAIEGFNALIASGEPQRRVERILAELDGRIAAALSDEDPADAARAIVDAEQSARGGMMHLTDELDIRRPRGVGLTKPLERSYVQYETDRAELTIELIGPALNEIEERIEHAANTNQLAVDRRVRFDAAVEQAAEHSRESTRAERLALQAASRTTTEEVKRLTDRGTAAVEGAVQDALAAAARLDVAVLSDRDFVTQRTEIEEAIARAASEQARALQSVTAQLQALTWPQNGTGDYATALDEVEALESDLEGLRESASEDLELRQMGLAVEVINHEFRSLIRQIRRSLGRLQEWASVNPLIRESADDLKSSFEHLDAYLRLFTPLHRRLQRGPVKVTGRSLHTYLRDLFGKRMKDARIELKPSKAFLEATIHTYPSTMYPVFVNLLDNAIYWLSDYNGARRIELDAGEGWLSVEDTGPGVPYAYRDVVFEHGFSEKPGGTGLGLYISREVLSREGMSLGLADPSADRGARFLITIEE
ncbi:MAG TPA: ATP-binding protein [Solirubrobacteraceae bacterium]|jgi:signal transduction histidine kinase